MPPSGGVGECAGHRSQCPAHPWLIDLRMISRFLSDLSRAPEHIAAAATEGGHDGVPDHFGARILRRLKRRDVEHVSEPGQVVVLDAGKCAGDHGSDLLRTEPSHPATTRSRAWFDLSAPKPL